MKICVTGASGYIGSVIGPYLIARGHSVAGFDAGFYESPLLFSENAPRPSVTRADIRNLTREDFAGFDAVVHLAGLSNDPLGQLDPILTRSVNFEGSLNVAREAREAGVRRYLDFSSCSVYGAGGDYPRTETSAVGPLTEYARCKVMTETAVRELATVDFSPVIMRNSTVFGASPRMRFDLVLNNLAGLAHTRGEIALVSDGTPWRPLIHILDICRAAALLLEAPRELVHNEVFNVGDDRMNWQVRDIAQAVSCVFPGCKLTVGSSGGDNRSYRVSFAKIRERLGFGAEWDLERGARELKDVFERVQLVETTFLSPPFIRIKRIVELMESGKVDLSLFWQAPAPAAVEVPHEARA
jgi:nucleoside-diphosphate-sugar epimerase